MKMSKEKIAAAIGNMYFSQTISPMVLKEWDTRKEKKRG